MSKTRGFKQFILEQDVIAVGVGLVMGLAIKEFIDGFLAAFITPLLDKLMGGGAGALEGKVTDIGGVQFQPGLFISSTIDFFVVAFVVYATIQIFNSAKSPKSSDSSKK